MNRGGGRYGGNQGGGRNQAQGSQGNYQGGQGGGFQQRNQGQGGYQGNQGGYQGGQGNRQGGYQGNQGASQSAIPPVQLPAFQKGSIIQLNHGDSDDAIGFLSTGRALLRARRSADFKKPWVGIRANVGIQQGRGAFAVINDTGGNIRIGFSLIQGSLELGLDQYSFGFGGTGTKSHNNQFVRFGQTFGKNDIVTALIDFDRHAIQYMINDHLLPGDCHSIPSQLWGHAFFPHVLVKEPTFEIYFGPSQGELPLTIKNIPTLPAGFKWLSELPLVKSPKIPTTAPQMIDEDQARVIEGQAIDLLHQSKARNQACHREQFSDWKQKVNTYARHFQQPLAMEYKAEKEQVMQRISSHSTQQLMRDGYGCYYMKAQFFDQVKKKGAEVFFLRLTPTKGRIPHMAEISIGRTVLISDQDGQVKMGHPEYTISGEVEEIGGGSIIISTDYTKLPLSRSNLYRCDLGPNVATYERIDTIIDALQRQDPVKPGEAPYFGIVHPGTTLANCLFADISETSAAAKIADPSARPIPNPNSDISKAARERHDTFVDWTPSEYIPEPKPLNPSQMRAMEMVLSEERKLTFVQGPPGTGKTTTAIEIICGWIRLRKGPILATAFSNKGTDNLAAGLWNRGVNVLRLGHCDPSAPFSMESHLGGSRGSDKDSDRKVIQSVDVICATCIGAGMKLMKGLRFPFVVVDEAAQIVEPACLIPISKGSRQVVMVGDQCQLPATVISNEAQNKCLDVSLFERMLTLGMEVHMLGIQYRMHPLIAHFPSWRFYRAELMTGCAVEDREHKFRILRRPLCFINVDGSEGSQGSSKFNEDEAECVATLIKALEINPLDIGVITPYAAQVTHIRHTIKSLVNDSNADHMTVASVDSFQGSENEVIIVSMVRSNAVGSGFISDWRRINVALTRAKKLCVVVGNMNTLTRHPLWRDWVGFHACLPKQSIDWCNWDSNTFNIGPLENNTIAVNALKEAQRYFASSKLEDLRKALPTRGDYPGMAPKEMLEANPESAQQIAKMGKKPAKAEAEIRDTEKKAYITGDEVMKRWLMNIDNMAKELAESGGKGNWTEMTNALKMIGLTLSKVKSSEQQQERRIDVSDGNAYTKEEFIEAYGGLEEWESAQPVATSSAPAPAKAAAPSKPKPKPSAPVVEKRIDPADGQEYTIEDFIQCYGGTKEWELAKPKSSTTSTPPPTATPAPQQPVVAKSSAQTEPEKRIDVNDGQAYTKQEFIDCYGGLDEWNTAKPVATSTTAKPSTSAPSQPPKPATTSVPKPTPEPSAPAPKPTPKAVEEPERRIDVNDGKAYTKEEFIDCYGGLDEWNTSKPATTTSKPSTSAPSQSPKPATTSSPKPTPEPAAAAPAPKPTPKAAKAGPSSTSLESVLFKPKQRKVINLAGPAPSIWSGLVTEKRIDPQDNLPHSQQEFIEKYGGLKEWEKCVYHSVSLLPSRAA